MPQLIQPQVVKVVPRDGELEVILKIDINITGNVNYDTVDSKKESKILDKDDSESSMLIPEFKPTGKKVKFGKQEKK